MSIETNRRIGGYGAALTVLGAVGTVLSVYQYSSGNLNTPSAYSLVISGVASVVGVAALIGFILFLVAMYGLSKDYGERRIFNYVIYGIIAAIILGIAVFVAAFALFFANLPSLISSFNPSTPPSSSSVLPLVLSWIAPLVAVIAGIALVLIVFYMLAFNLLAKKSGVSLFKVGAKILLAGVIVSLIIAVVFAALTVNGSIDYSTLVIAGVPGGLVQEVGWVVLAIAFFRIKPSSTQTVAQSYVSSPQNQVIYCSNCGSKNTAESTFCVNCGQRLRR